MKRIISVTLTLFLSSMAMADTTLANNMAQMENGLSQVQKGFLYNNPLWIKNGVTEIHTANLLFHNMEETKKYLPKEKQHMGNIAFNASKRIDKASADLVKFLDKKQFSKASQSYSEIVNACTMCHGVVRGW